MAIGFDQTWKEFLKKEQVAWQSARSGRLRSLGLSTTTRQSRATPTWVVSIWIEERGAIHDDAAGQKYERFGKPHGRSPSLMTGRIAKLHCACVSSQELFGFVMPVRLSRRGSVLGTRVTVTLCSHNRLLRRVTRSGSSGGTFGRQSRLGRARLRAVGLQPGLFGARRRAATPPQAAQAPSARATYEVEQRPGRKTQVREEEHLLKLAGCSAHGPEPVQRQSQEHLN